ncbi:hypothetical protein OHA25_41080 [Nonomuraea sp. NBC_00507]|uniref:hypothetical protein n=1 Tax=Nonomuraea sp. NBC_00507 TaxID=2976002 RepID=UPI002E16ED04
MSSNSVTQSRRDRIALMCQKAQQPERRRRLIAIGLSTAFAAGAVGALSWGIVASRGADAAAAKLAMEGALPPWPLTVQRD